ncbi:GNAT family N-acetyltransferase [Colwellia sp. 1_MG-2023]|uniref:GNAT family N-acetyltransferase n=1 Tax=Colwellia sp. 1_MG-2023 TaxID=3062649 RepID=UPI0026E2DE69|nr:GNAT family N-acetyltransferase [Colwellia sp. 1_MG-2023]MDO6445851.1 GNAT family N-acetyltransferase [Colwellia sp. 1_MG-2023]
MNRLTLIPCSQDHIETLRTWSTQQDEVTQWAGPNVRFPHTLQTFLADLKYPELPSYGLINEKKALVAFGQFYQRLGHCHLGRLIVNPDFRRQGIAKILVEALSNKAQQVLQLTDLSLFVYQNNTAAITLYKKLGFNETNYPEDMPLTDCLYLTKISD